MSNNPQLVAELHKELRQVVARERSLARTLLCRRVLDIIELNGITDKNKIERIRKLVEGISMEERVVL